MATAPARTIWERRAEVGLTAPDSNLRASTWRRFRVLAIAQGARGYDPWPSFAKAHHSPATFVICVGAERVGKSVATAAEGFSWLPVSNLIWIAGPHYAQTKKEFEYLAEACINAGITKKRDVKWNDKGPGRIVAFDKTRNQNVIIETRSLYDIHQSIVSEAPDLIMVVEAGLVPHDPIDKLRLRVSTRRGRVFLSGTLEDASPWFLSAYRRWTEWPNEELGMSISVPLYENQQDFPGGAENVEIQTLRRTLKPSTYSHRVEGKPAPSELLVFNKTFRRGALPFCADPSLRLVRLDANRDRCPVEIAVDPGYRPSYYAVNFIQKQGDKFCVIDEVAMQGAFHEEVIREVMRRPAWENVVGGVMDPWAAKQHGLANEQTPWDIWLAETGLQLRLPEPAPVPVQIIDRFLFYLRHPHNGECRFYYNPDACPRLDFEWGHWRYMRDQEGRPVITEPLKRDCDAIKAVGYYLVDAFGQHMFERRQITRKPKITNWRLR